MALPLDLLGFCGPKGDIPVFVDPNYVPKTKLFFPPDKCFLPPILDPSDDSSIDEADSDSMSGRSTRSSNAAAGKTASKSTKKVSKKRQSKEITSSDSDEEADFEIELTNTKAKVKDQRAQIDELKAQLEAEKARAEAAQLAKNPKTNPELAAQVREKVIFYGFRKYKFLVNKTITGQAVREIYNLMGPKFAQKMPFDAFSDGYTQVILSTINGKRQYVQQNLREKIWHFCREHSLKEIPSSDIIRACAVRTCPEGWNEADFDEYMQWYADVLLPVATGNGQDWTVEAKANTTISKHLCTKTLKPIISPSTEAFLVLCWENCEFGWNVQWAYQKKFKTTKAPQARKLDKDDPFLANIPATKDLDAYVKALNKCKTKEEGAKLIPFNRYSNSCSGQKRYGGWSKEGRDRFVALRTQIKKARETEEAQAVEEKLLAFFQANRPSSAGKKKNTGEDDEEEEDDEEGVIDDDE